MERLFLLGGKAVTKKGGFFGDSVEVSSSSPSVCLFFFFFSIVEGREDEWNEEAYVTEESLRQ